MTVPKTAPFGAWKSPITADLIVEGAIGMSQVQRDGDDLYWIEMRPMDGGRHVIVRRTPDGQASDLTPSPFNARTRVHEYGGGDYLAYEGRAYFANFGDQQLYRVRPGEAPEALTTEPGLRYADFRMDPGRGLLYSVREDHRATGREAVNAIVSLDPNTGRQQVLASGNDFYAAPRLSPNGNELAWITWNHPNMPWDGTELWVGEIGEDGSLANSRLVAGGLEESVIAPQWSPDGALHFVSDRTSGWWNLYRLKDGGIEPLCPMEAEFGGPAWNFGGGGYAFESEDRILCVYIQNGLCHLASLTPSSGQLDAIQTPYSVIGSLNATPGGAYFLGGSSQQPGALVHLDLKTGEIQTIRKSSETVVDPGYLTAPLPVEFPTEGGMTAYGIFYPPKNQDFAAPEGEKPPLVVHSHGGPTGMTMAGYNLGIQYFTSRGFAILDVNYGGSTGYGREYRDRLKGQWGIVDVQDCANGAKWLAEQGLVDGDRLAIQGGSAGGYTTLAALAFTDTFKAGASYFGVSDLEALALETHKFESRYLDGLIGPYPERKDLYDARSPIHHTDRLSCPVIFFQGLEDAVVPPNQAERMVDALKAKGIPVAYVPFSGEQHGFRRAENIKRALEGEMYFYSRIFGFTLAEPVAPVPIENLEP